jgi:hypothetical protein
MARLDSQTAHRQRESLGGRVSLLLLLPVPAMAGLDPSRTGGFPVEVEAATATDAAVTCAGAFEGRLRRPGKGALLVGKDGRCMFILHDRPSRCSLPVRLRPIALMVKRERPE